MLPIVLKRHGDLMIMKIDSLPSGLKELESPILAIGETTGHAHKFNRNVLIYENPMGMSMGNLLPNLGLEGDLKDAKVDRFFVVDCPLELTHDEHKALLIEKGIYAVINEREYDPFAAAVAEDLLAKELKDRKAREKELRRREFWHDISD